MGIANKMMYYQLKHTKDLYQVERTRPFRLSRSKIELLIECPQCFYLNCKLGIPRPDGPPFTLNLAVDELLKKEFDIHRAKNTRHPLMETHGVDAVPFQDSRIHTWRNARSAGITYLHEPTNFFVTGGVDDVWVNPQGELLIVDYKATAKKSEVGIDAEWQKSYKRQMEVYQWLFRKNGFRVNNTAYFVYCNGDTDKEAFDGKLEFNIKIIPYEGNDSWIEQALFDAQRYLEMEVLPQSATGCEYCQYRSAVARVLP